MIAVLDYGIGNLRSAQKALQRVGADAHLVTESDAAAAADGVVLPGVGAFGACMDALRASGLDRAVFEALDRQVPFLGICVGMQMLYESSEESPGVSGLGAFPGTVRPLADSVKRPQMQWNELDVAEGSKLLHDLPAKPWVYFVHSYAAPAGPGVSATCDYGGTVTAAVETGTLWATQFHPEKSGAVGMRILENYVEACN